MAGPMGIVMAIGISVVLGWCLMVALLFSIQDLAGTINSTTGEPVAQIFLDTVHEKGAIFLMARIPQARFPCGACSADITPQVIVIGAMFFCGTFSITSNSRMMYAFARDGGIPGHKLFHKVDSKYQSPVRTGQSVLQSSVSRYSRASFL